MKRHLILSAALFALPAITLAAADSKIGAESFDAKAIMNGIADTKIKFRCKTDGAILNFEVTKSATYTEIYRLDKSGELIAVEDIRDRGGKSCPEKMQIPIGDYCVRAVCLVKETVPAKPVSGDKLNFEPRPNPLDTVN